MTVKEKLAESIRKDGQSRWMKAYIASMPERDKKQASMMIGLVKEEYDLDAVHCPAPSSGYDPYTYVSVEDVLFRSRVGDGITILEMQDHKGRWHVLVEACRESASKKKVLEILQSETSSELGFGKGEG